MDSDTRIKLLAEGEKATFVTLFSNIFLIILKLIIGLFIGSVAVFASALDAITDAFGSLAVLFGLRYSQKDPSKRFPYGYYRMETLATLVVAIFILFFGLDVMIISAQSFFSPSSLNHPALGLIISLVSIGGAYWLYRYNLRVGSKIRSNALISTANEFKLDMLTNSLVFIGVFSHIILFPQLEGLVGLLISLLIVKTGIEFGKSSILTLLDAVDDPEVIETIKLIISNFTDIKDISNIRLRRSGPYYFVDIQIRVDAKKTISAISQVTHNLESSLKKDIPQLDSVMISVEPSIKIQMKVAIPIPSLEIGMNGIPEDHFGQTHGFLIVCFDTLSKRITSQYTIENPHRLAERKRGLLSAELLINEEIDILVIKDPETFGVGPKALLSDHNIQIQPYQGNTIGEIMKNISFS